MNLPLKLEKKKRLPPSAAFPSGNGVRSGTPLVSTPKKPGSDRFVGNELSRLRKRLGAKRMVDKKSLNSCIWLVVSCASAASKSVKVTLKLSMFGRSPRQCKGRKGWLSGSSMMFCKVWVTSGPFMGWNTSPSPGKKVTSPLGSPRSHASRSKRASAWQDAHEAWPRPEVRRVS